MAFRPGRRVLLVHRPRYDDWSFPKGKLDRGEHAVAAAVREAEEETGLHVRLCRPLTDQRYTVGPRPKTVSYWTARVVGSDDVSAYRPNDEIDDVRWVEAEEADGLLTYRHDRATLAEALEARHKTHAVVVLRHGEARARRTWRRPDQERPLLVRGLDTAVRLVPLLAAYDVTHVVTSPSVRCAQTVQPYAETAGWELDQRRRLSEEDAGRKGVARVVEELLDDEAGAVLCTHRPVLPLVFDALGVEPMELAPGEFAVLHVRRGHVVGVERHLPR